MASTQVEPQAQEGTDQLAAGWWERLEPLAATAPRLRCFSAESGLAHLLRRSMSRKRCDIGSGASIEASS